MPQPGLIGSIEHKESAAPSSDELAADRAAGSREFVPFVNFRIADSRRAPSLLFPVFIHQLGDFSPLPPLKGALRAQTQLLDLMHTGQHGSIVLLAFLILVLEDRRGRPRVPGEKNHQIVFQIVERFRRKPQRLGFHPAILPEIETSDASESGNVLILLADRLPQAIDFDLASLRRQLIGMHQVFAQSMQSLEQRRGKASRGSQARAGRNVRHAGDFEVKLFDSHQLQGFAEDGMLDLVDFFDVLELGILDDQLSREGLVNCDVDLFVERGGDQKAFVLKVI